MTSQLKVVFHLRPSSTYHDTSVDLIFVRTVDKSNLSLLYLAYKWPNFFYTHTHETNGQNHILDEFSILLELGAMHYIERDLNSGAIQS